MKKDELLKETTNKDVKADIVVQKSSVEKNDSSEVLSIKDFQKKYFWDFLNKDENKQNTKKLLFCCQ